MPNKEGDEEKKSRTSKAIKDVGPYLGTGFQLAATVAVMIFLGRWIDMKFDKEPLFTLIFAFAGVGLGMYNFIRTIIVLGKRSEKNESE